MRRPIILNIAALFAATAFNLTGQSLPGLYLTNAVVLTNGAGQFEVRTPDATNPYVLLYSFGKDFCYGLSQRWQVLTVLTNSDTYVFNSSPVPMSAMDNIFFRAAPLNQPMYWLSYSISSYGTLSNGVGVVSWPKQPDGWNAQLTVQNATNFPAASEILFTGPPGSLITNKPPDSDSGSGYKHYYYVSGPSAAPPAGTWQVQYAAEALTFPMADPQVSSRYVVMVPTVVVSNGYLTSVSWTYRNPATGVVLDALPDYIAGSRSVTVSDTNGQQIYDSPPGDRTRTGHVFGPPFGSIPVWNDVGSVNIGFHDNWGNEFAFYNRK